MLLLLPLMTVYVALLGVLSPPQVLAQSNYASHANNIGYQGEGLPEEATLDGKVSAKCPHNARPHALLIAST